MIAIPPYITVQIEKLQYAMRLLEAAVKKMDS
jgi:hypothetical protein